jgi:PDZ domain-containing protein
MGVLTVTRRDSKVDRLARHPLLQRCTPQELRRLALTLDEVDVAAGSVLLEATPLARWFCLIDEGDAEVVDAKGRVGVLHGGDSCGQAALKLRDPQVTTVRALTDVRAFATSGREMLGLVSDLPSLRAGALGAFIPPPAPPAPPIAPQRRPPVRPRPRPVGLRPLPRPAVAPPPARPRLTRRVVLSALGAVAVLIVGAARYHPPVMVLGPGPVVDITNDVTITGATTHAPSGRYLLTTVRATRPSLLDLGLLGFRGQVEVVRLHGEPGSDERRHRRGRADFDASRKTAALAAAKAAGFDVSRGALPFRVTFRERDIVGPSGGLAYALLITDMLSPGDVSTGRLLAATGTIDADGHVGLVGGIPEKAVALRRAGGALLLLPVDQLVGAGELGITVVGVNSLADALSVLRATG